jgi:hypothetical protein
MSNPRLDYRLEPAGDVDADGSPPQEKHKRFALDLALAA